MRLDKVQALLLSIDYSLPSMFAAVQFLNLLFRPRKYLTRHPPGQGSIHLFPFLSRTAQIWFADDFSVEHLSELICRGLLVFSC